MDRDTRRDNAAVVLTVIEARGGDGRVLRAIAGRESGLNHAIEHRLPADAKGSIRAWRRNQRLFADNPHYEQMGLWDHGKGLFGMMPAYHLQRWDPTAHPDVLLNPWVASVVASRLVRSCMRSGARTWADVDQCWATGRPRRTVSWEPRRQRMIRRLQRLGYPPGLVDVKPEPGDWGRGPQPGQMDALWALAEQFDPSLVEDAGDDIELHDDRGALTFTPPPGEPQSWHGLWVAAALLGLGGVGLALATKRG